MKLAIRLVPMVLILLFVAMHLSACQGLSKDPAIGRIQTATITCQGITASINILATMKAQLSAVQIAAVDTILPIVEPICGVAHTSGDVIDLDALQNYLFELQKITGGA